VDTQYIYDNVKKSWPHSQAHTVFGSTKNMKGLVPFLVCDVKGRKVVERS